MPDSIRRPPSEPAAPSGQGGSDGRQEWPGQRLGLPREGPRSIARLGRRVGGLVIDWALASVVAYAFFGGEGLAITAVFVVVQVLFLVTLGGTPGHLALGMRLVPMRGGAVGLWRPLVRTLLVALVVPAVVWDLDQRGLHDRIAGTVLVRV
ncbi:putative RDD family membrane protein YckC [Frigoribacterium sp. PvP120]|jgi:uncharacterized RDD family membrane protein YckC|uniref:RDD family protein n=1 Tax=unclassified Frigoribacterium TaxID=2627005 RepID=UPI001AE76C6E|nr:RDD family protein [Frigoribacterium sp. PvP121]MBP1241771.1 putative RDD family membrane protein YckC [Frigoribacterium sp. PvP121]